MDTLSRAENTLHPSYEGGRVSNAYIWCKTQVSGIIFRSVVQPFLGDAYELVGGPGHVAALVIADAQDAVGPGVVQGVQVQAALFQDRAAVGREAGSGDMNILG